MKKYTRPDAELLSVCSMDVITASAGITPIDYVFSSAPGFGDTTGYDWT
ncbi:MAG: hypothetical protein IJ011_03285 [Clostridia bacterium]|nr:hypothetical protein [Clostridia bacterium]